MSIGVGRLLTGLLLQAAVCCAFAGSFTPQTSQPDGTATADFESLKQQLAARPEWTEGWWKLGTAAYEANQFETAVSSLEHVVQAAPRMGLAWDLLGLSEFELKEYAKARSVLERAAALNNSGDAEVDRVAAYHLSLLLIHDGKFEEAATLLRATFPANPNSQASLAMGLAVLRVPLLPDEVDPSREALLVEVGSAAARGKDGLQDFAKIVEANPTVPLLHFAYGETLQRAGDSAAASSEFEREVRISPESARVWTAVATSQHQAGNTKAARVADEKAARFAKDEAAEEARSRRWFAPAKVAAGAADLSDGMRSYVAGQYEVAAQRLSGWVAAHPEDGTAWAVLGLSEFKLHHYDDARVHLERGAQLGFRGDAHSVAEAHYTLAVLLLRTGEFDRASAELAVALRLAGESERIDAAFGLDLLRSPSLPGDSAEPLLLRAGKIQIMLLGSRYDEALPAFEALLAEYPQKPFLHYAYGGALMALSEFDKASAEMLAEERISPNSPLPYEGLASIALREHRPADALDPAKRAVALLPAAAEPHYLLGRALLESETNVPTAVRELERAAQLDPNSPEVHFSLAKAYARASDPQKAAKERAVFLRLNETAQAEAGAAQPQVYSGPRRGSILSQPAGQPDDNPR